MALMRHLINELNRPVSLCDQHFGLGLDFDDLLVPRLSQVPVLSGYYRPWRHQLAKNSGRSNIQDNKDIYTVCILNFNYLDLNRKSSTCNCNCSYNFQVNLDVQQFKPEELSVKMIDDFVVIEAEHEEREDEHGYISRKMQRRYKLPKDVDPALVQSHLSSDGVLKITAPKKASVHNFH